MLKISDALLVNYRSLRVLCAAISTSLKNLRDLSVFGKEVKVFLNTVLSL